MSLPKAALKVIVLYIVVGATPDNCKGYTKSPNSGDFN